MDSIGGSSVDTESLYSRRRALRRSPSIRNRWSSREDFLVSSLSCCLTDKNLSHFVFDREDLTRGNILQFFAAYAVIGLPLYYMQMFFGQYTQIGVITLKYMCPIAQGLCYSYIVNCYLSSVILSLDANMYMIYFLTSMQAHIPWSVCPRNNTECWTNDENNTKCEKNCLDDKQFAADAFFEGKFEEYQPLSLFQHRELLPIFLLWFTIVCLLIYAISNQKKLKKRLLYFSLFSFCVVLMGCILENGISYFFEELYHVNFNTLIYWESWCYVCCVTIDKLALGKGFQILNGSYLSPTAYCGFYSVASVLANFFVTLCMSSVTQLCLGIIRSVSKTEHGHKVAFTYDSGYQTFTNIPQALSLLSIPQLWTSVYFFGLLSLTVNNIVCHLITIEKFLTDVYPTLMRYRRYIFSILCMVCSVTAFVIVSADRLIESVLSHTSEASKMSRDFNTTVLSIVVCWLYGVGKLCDDIHFLTGKQPNKFWKTCWNLLPIITTATLISSITDSNGDTSAESKHDANDETDYDYDDQSVTDSTTEASTSKAVSLYFLTYISPIIIVAVFKIFHYIKRRNIVGLLRSDVRFGPPSDEDKRLRNSFNPRTEIRSRQQHGRCNHACLVGSKVLQKLVQKELEMNRQMHEQSWIISSASDDF